jgi:hypothetical protein
LHAPEPELVEHPSDTSAPSAERDRQLPVELRLVVGYAGPQAVEASIGRPSGLAPVLRRSGGTAAIRTVLATRAVP